MPKEILMPELAESVVEGEILKWLVEEGDYLKKDQPRSTPPSPSSPSPARRWRA